MKKVRALFVSDFHLGKRWSKTDEIIKFLQEVEAEYVYRVGNIIDDG